MDAEPTLKTKGDDELGNLRRDQHPKNFQNINISCTVERIEAKYSFSGRSRPKYPVKAIILDLMLTYLLQIPSISMLSTGLCRHCKYAELCGFNGRTPERSTFSKFIRELGLKPLKARQGA